MPITINQINNTASGFCHEYTVTINKDGSVSPATLSFGNYGDKNITQIKFDLSDLTYQGQFNLKNYTHVLVVRFPEVVDEENGLDYKTYELSYDENSTSSVFEVPEEITTSGVLSYQLIYALLESSNEGNVADQQEIFISKTFLASMQQTDWSDDIDLQRAITYSDSELSLVKPRIILSPESSHSVISASGSNLGEKRDSFIKRIILNEDSESKLDEGLINRFLIIGDFVIRMNFDVLRKNICSCFIPKDITTKAGTYSYFIIAENNDGDKRWVSNTLTLTVNDNFLDDKKDITITSENNLLTSDNISIISSDGWLVDTK